MPFVPKLRFDDFTIAIEPAQLTIFTAIGVERLLSQVVL